jgi:peptidoglycan/LPS O-acetylase OafA/YrhL
LWRCQSIEEVFYLVFPASLLLFRKRSLLVAGLAVLLVIGPVHRAAVGSTFYDYFSNFDQLAIGVLAAFLAWKARLWSLSRPMLRFCRWLGIGIVLLTFWFTQNALKAAMWGSKFVGLGAAIYLFGSSDRTRPCSFGILWIPEFFGRLSYEVYLFHMFFLVAIGPFGDRIGRSPAVAIVEDNLLAGGVLAALAVLSIAISGFYSEPLNRLIRRVVPVWRSTRGIIKSNNPLPLTERT